MLKQLRFQNFKSWKDTGEMQLTPLTGLFGTNSSGKTAILQFLLMLKQTVEINDLNRILYFGDRNSYVSLGSTYDVVYRHELPQEFSFKIRWSHDNRIPLILPNGYFSHLQRDESSGLETEAPDLEVHSEDIEFQASIELASDQMSVRNFIYRYQLASADIGIGMSFQELSGQEPRYKFQLEGNTQKLPKSKELLPPPLKTYRFPSVARAKLNDGEATESLVFSFEELFDSIYYLGPLREYPNRTYFWSGASPQGVGKQGQFTVDALLAARKKGLETEEKVAEGLQKLGLVQNFQIQKIAEGRQEYEIKIQKEITGPYVTITDVGFGVSQILPVLVLCYTVPEGSTILLEQPEIHLHPSAQSELADVFIDVIKTRNVQIILESHSEHLLHRLQRRIAEEDKGFTNEDAAFYFCQTNDTGDSFLTTLEVDPFGNILNWPKNFFGNEMEDLFLMTEAAAKRQKVSEAS